MINVKSIKRMNHIFRNFIVFLFFMFSFFHAFAQSSKAIVESYESENRVRSGIAMGGIGTGSIEMRKDGNFYNWSIFNNYPFGTGSLFKLKVNPYSSANESYLFFLVRYQVEGESPKLKLLQLNNSINEGAQEGLVYYYPWLESVDKIKYAARFPFSNFVFSDNEMPFDIELEAFSPFIPHDLKNSSLPGVYFNFTIHSKSEKAVDVMLIGTLRNLVGYDMLEKSFASDIYSNDQFKFFVHSAKNMDESKSSFGQMGLGAIGGNEVSYYLGWENKHPYYEKLLISDRFPNIDDTENRNFKTKEGISLGRFAQFDNDQRCFSSIAVSHKLKAGSDQCKASFFMNWNFPNKYGAVNQETDKSLSFRKNQDYHIGLKQTKLIGFYYQNYFKNIREIATYFFENAPELAQKSHSFQDDMYASDIKPLILDQINSHLNTFVTSTTLTKERKFLIREGLTSSQYWGPNATIDVALYGSPMIIALFPELQKSMMRLHKNLQTPEGEINHGLGFDPDFNQNGTWGVYERVDLVPNYIQMVLRDYLWTNDKTYLTEMWPSVKSGINYILKHRDKDGDQMPDMNGIMCSYDNFPMYGLASYIQSQWIVALTMASEIAAELGEKSLSKQYKAIAIKGSKLMESKLWNGSYFNLSNDYHGEKGIDNGCLTDQLIGQWVAHGAGMGYIFDEQKVKTSLQTILNKSFREKKFLRNCSWPAYPDLFPIEKSDLWVDQANTPWSGVELAFASFLIYENLVAEGEQIIKAVDDRYRKANLYFDHQEFGGHYFRPMSAWSIMNAYLGFSVNRGKLSFNPKINQSTYSVFFVTPDATAFYCKTEQSVELKIRTGNLTFSTLSLPSDGFMNKKPCVYIDNVEQKSVKMLNNNGLCEFVWPKQVAVNKGSVIKIR